jgi:hypothetical protein
MNPTVGFVLQQNLHYLLLTNFTCTNGYTQISHAKCHINISRKLLREEESVAAAWCHVYDQFGLVAQTFHNFPHRLRISVTAGFSQRTVLLMPSLLFFVCNQQVPVVLIYCLL